MTYNILQEIQPEVTSSGKPVILQIVTNIDLESYKIDTYNAYSILLTVILSILGLDKTAENTRTYNTNVLT